jgi:hypothetical protein
MQMIQSFIVPVRIIEANLSYNMDLIANYLEDNELIVNLEKSKTRSVVWNREKAVPCNLVILMFSIREKL